MTTNDIKNWSKDQLKTDWIEKGLPCIYRYGYRYKGASYRYLTKEEALKLLPGYSIGIGFYELNFTYEDGQQVLQFNEFSENDML